MKKVCIYHISEIYLYEYYCRPGDYEIDPVDRVTPLLEKAEGEEKRGGLIGALQAYEKAQALNPVSTQIRLRIIDCCYRLNNVDKVEQCTRELYPFLATRAEMAAYYRWLGWSALERYQPELAEVLYRYSTLFTPSQTAENEIRYLETALSRPMPSYTVTELQEKLRAAKLPTAASNVTMALIWKAGQEAEEKGNLRQARDCYEMVYDLTADPEVRTRLAEVTRQAETGEGAEDQAGE